MNNIQEKSLQLMDGLFNGMDNTVFLKEYESMEKNIGPTFEPLASINLYSKFMLDVKRVKYGETLEHEHYEIKKIKKITTPKNINDTYAANDEEYSEQPLVAEG